MTTSTSEQGGAGRLRVGLVGFGNRALLGRLVDEHPGAQVTAVCDPDPAALDDARRAHPDAELFGTLPALLGAGVDAVMVLSPDHTHESVAVAALERGLAVFCEKPLAITADGADRILSTALEAGARLYVGHNMRHLPMVLTMRRLIAEGAVGQVEAIWCRHFVGNGGDYYFKDWHADRRNTTGLLLQKGAHDIDVIHWLAGAPTRRVTALGRLAVYGDGARSLDDRQRARDVAEPDAWPPSAHSRLHPVVDVEDISMMLMQLGNGVMASYQQCHFTPDYWRNYTVIGDEGRLENVGDMDSGEVRVWNRRHPGYAAPDVVVPFSAEPGTHGGADRALIAEFVEYAVHGGYTRTSPLAAREAVAAGEAATRSLRAGGQPVDVPPPPDEVSRSFRW
ncbi:Putative oxidoreductase YteT [Propionicimonas sp. T2.31MG-18]|uniref:Gfo/Idh/MocA family protein n=1 Tax=Propionicimonas sp. T2.31MG-18 TaxID=3157620 RepID=UPI0035ECD573